MTLSPGIKLGRYEIRSQIGAGGMGEVYLAHDTQLDRIVALKTLPADVVGRSDRLRRFTQEAKAASALNHPNILTIFEIGQTGSTHFIATEFIDGETLRQRLKGQTLNLGEVLSIAAQVADALSSAHEAGIFHRDVKPENIMVRRRDGYVKVLDFGLAKLGDPPATMLDAEAATRPRMGTDPGVVLGTVQYMSPEQARGLDVDARTDIFSLGVVLYEMIAGCLPFEGKTNTDVIASILDREPPPLARYSREVPETLEWIVTKALRKDRDDRYQTARELLTDLRSLKQRLEFVAEQERSLPPTSKSEAPVTNSIAEASLRTIERPAEQTGNAGRPTTSAEYLISEIKQHKRAVLLSLIAAVLLLVSVVVGLKFLRSPTKTTAPFSKMKVTRLTTTGKASYAAISPDGKYVVHISGSSQQQSLLLRHIATGSDTEIVPSNGNDFTWITFSRDGSYVLYCRIESGTYPLYQVAVLGGTPRKVMSEDVDTPVTYSPDGKRLAFMRGAPERGETLLIVANADGTGEQKLVTRKISDFQGPWPSPSWSPDGQFIAFAHRTPDGDGRNTNVIMASVKDGTEKQMTSHNWSTIQALVWIEDGSGLFITAADREPGSPRQIWHVSYPGGEAQRVTNDANNYLGVSLTSDSSALVTVLTEQLSDIWIAPNGEAGLATQVSSSRNDGGVGVVWTPDGRIVYASGVRELRDIWIMNPDGTGRTQLTANAGNNTTPSVSPDGRYIVFISTRGGGGATSIWRTDIDGSNPKRLTDGDRDMHPTISPDGKWVLYTSTESDKQRLGKVSIDGGETVQLTTYSSASPQVSPDGKLIACGYIDQTPPAHWKLAIISSDGGPPIKTFDISTLQSRYEWAADGRALLYTLTRNGVTNIWSQPIDGGSPKQLTDFKSDLIFRFDWSRDGKQLVLARGSISSDVILISGLR